MFTSIDKKHIQSGQEKNKLMKKKEFCLLILHLVKIG